MHLAGDGMPCKTNHPQDCIQDSSGNLAILQSCGWLVLQGIASPARCIQDSPGNLAILQSCGWSVPQCKLRKLAFPMMMKEQSCKLFGRCVWFPVISGGQPPPPSQKPMRGWFRISYKYIRVCNNIYDVGLGWPCVCCKPLMRLTLLQCDFWVLTRICYKAGSKPFGSYKGVHFSYVSYIV